MVIDSIVEWGGHSESLDFPERTDYKSLLIVVGKPIVKRDIVKLVTYAEKFEQVKITVSNCIYDTYDLSFLESFPFLDSFSLTSHLFKDFDQLNSIPSKIKSLRIGSTNSTRLSLSFISKFTELKTLSLEKQKRDIEVISDLRDLEGLSLRSITMPDLSFIGNTQSLKSLRLALGGTKNLDSLPDFKILEKLDLWAINKISNIDSIADCPSLNKIELDQLSNVELVKSFKNLVNLKSLKLCRMKRLQSLQWLADAPNLKKFSLTETTHFEPDAFLPLTKSKSLQAACIYIGRKHSITVRDMLGLPEPEIEYNY
jgi:hypothetical protein